MDTINGFDHTKDIATPAYIKKANIRRAIIVNEKERIKKGKLRVGSKKRANLR